MSRYEDECDELRDEVRQNGLKAVADRRDTPAQSGLQRHVKNRCLCKNTLPPVEFDGKGGTGIWRFQYAPACPDCQTPEWTNLHGNQNKRYIICHACKEQFALEDVIERLTNELEDVPAPEVTA